MTTYESTSIIVSIVLAIINFGALAFVGLQVRQGASNTKAAAIQVEREWQQRHREWSLKFYLDTVEIRDEHKRSLPADRDDAAVAALIEEAKTSHAKEAAIRTYLSMHELLATGVNMEVLDVDIVDRFDGPALAHVWRNYAPWIKRERERRNEDSLYCEIETLGGRMEESLRRRRQATPLSPSGD